MPYGRKTQGEKTVSRFLSLYVAERTKKGDFTSKVQGKEEDGARLKKEEMGRRLLCTHRRIMGRNDPPPPPLSETSLLDICLLTGGRGAAAHTREATMIFLQLKKHPLAPPPGGRPEKTAVACRGHIHSPVLPPPFNRAQNHTLIFSPLHARCGRGGEGGRICFFPRLLLVPKCLSGTFVRPSGEFSGGYGGGRRRGGTNRMEGRWQTLVFKIGMQQHEGL